MQTSAKAASVERKKLPLGSFAFKLVSVDSFIILSLEQSSREVRATMDMNANDSLEPTPHTACAAAPHWPARMTSSAPLIALPSRAARLSKARAGCGGEAQLER